MRVMLIAAMLLAVVLAGCADEIPQPTGDDDEKFQDLDLEATIETGIIRGLVTDVNIIPVGNATVKLLNTEFKTKTTPEGVFGFSDLEPGTYFLKISKPGYEEQQTSAEVVAGVNNPKVVKVIMDRLPGTEPFITPYSYTGYVSCSYKLANYVFDAWWCDPTNSLGYQTSDDSVQTFNFSLEDQAPEHFQSEIVWEANQPLSNGFVTIICARDNTGCGSGSGSDRICNVRGPSPLICKVNNDMPTSQVPGGGNNFTTIRNGEGPGPLFSVGVYSNCAYTCEPVFGVMGAGLALEQTYDLYVHLFYNFKANPDWIFITDGAHPVPES